ncbi:hypothetical protein BJX99DRAFT_235470 [Aspergillus californicus]
MEIPIHPLIPSSATKNRTHWRTLRLMVHLMALHQKLLDLHSWSGTLEESSH